jgi:hypothetical protein
MFAIVPEGLRLLKPRSRDFGTMPPLGKGLRPG